MPTSEPSVTASFGALTLGCISRVTLNIWQSQSLDHFLKTLVQEARELLKTDRVVVGCCQPNYWTHIIAESVEEGWKSILGSRLPFSELGSEAIALSNLSNSPFPDSASWLHLQVQASLMVPIPQPDRLSTAPQQPAWGYLMAHHCQSTRFWQPEELSALQHLALLCSLAVKQADLERQSLPIPTPIPLQSRSNQYSSYFRLLNAITLGRTANASIEQVIQYTLEQIYNFFGNLCVSYSQLNAPNQFVVIHTYDASPNPKKVNRIQDLSVVPDYRVKLQAGHPAIAPDITSEPRLMPFQAILQAQNTRALLSVPLRLNGELTAILSLSDAQPHTWNDYEIGILMEIADFLSLTLQEDLAQQARQKAEQALNNSERRFQAIFNQSVHFIGLLSPEGILLESNQTALDFCQLQPQDVVGRWFWDCEWWSFSKQHQERLKQAITQAARGELVRYEVDIQGANHQILTLDFSLKPVADETGKIILLIPEGRDITELRHTQAERDRFFNYSMDLMAIVDFDGYRQVVNPAWEQTLGYTQAETLGKHYTDFIHPDDVEHSRSVTQEAIAQNRPIIGLENRYRCQDGSYRWLSWNCIPFLEEQVIYAFARDITERKEAEVKLQNFNTELESQVNQKTAELKLINYQLRAEILERKRIDQELRQSEARIKNLAANIPGMIYQYLIRADGSDDFLYISPGCRDLWNIQPEAALQNSRLLWDIVHPDDLPILNDSTQISRTTLQPWYAEWRTISPSGCLKWVQGIARPELLGNGDIIWDGLIIDISDRKQIEQEIRDSLLEKETLLKEIHHRVKNNLQIISSLLRLQSHQIVDPTDLELFKESQNRVRTMALIHEMLYQSTNLAKINFADYIKNLIRELIRSYDAVSKGVSVQVEVTNIDLSIDTAIPCGLAINELVSNALKHAFPHQKEGKIWVELHSYKNHEITLKIQDNGIGIPVDFDFEQSTSLGLKLVYRLVNQINGKMIINNKNGTEFKIVFAG